jgi:hypothetical protein
MTDSHCITPRSLHDFTALSRSCARTACLPFTLHPSKILLTRCPQWSTFVLTFHTSRECNSLGPEQVHKASKDPRGSISFFILLFTSQTFRTYHFTRSLFYSTHSYNTSWLKSQLLTLSPPPPRRLITRPILAVVPSVALGSKVVILYRTMPRLAIDEGTVPGTIWVPPVQARTSGMIQSRPRCGIKSTRSLFSKVTVRVRHG